MNARHGTIAAVTSVSLSISGSAGAQDAQAAPLPPTSAEDVKRGFLFVAGGGKSASSLRPIVGVGVADAIPVDY